MITPDMFQRLLGDIDMEAIAGVLGGLRHSGRPDPYRILGLDRSCSDDELKARWRLLASKLHPDKSGTRATEALFHLVHDAYDQACKERGIA